MFNIIYIYIYWIYWLVVAANPSEKWWSESQLGWWHSQSMESHKIHVPNHQPIHHHDMGFLSKSEKNLKKNWNHIVFHPWHWYVSQKMKKKTWKTLKQPWKNPEIIWKHPWNVAGRPPLPPGVPLPAAPARPSLWEGSFLGSCDGKMSVSLDFVSL